MATTTTLWSQSIDSNHELHVLAVDDSLVDRKVIERLLKISSCKVTSVDSGSRALQYLGLDGDNSISAKSIGFQDLKVNLIITDYSMPGMTGYELLKKIKTSSSLSKIPVVIMSSENIMTRIDRCLEEGAEDFLLKPVKLSDVKRLTDSVLKGGEEEHVKEESLKRKVGHDSSPQSALSDDDIFETPPSMSVDDSSPQSASSDDDIFESLLSQSSPPSALVTSKRIRL